MPEMVQQVAEPAAPAREKVAKRSLKKNVMPIEFGGPQRPKSGYMLFGDNKREEVMIDLRAKAEAAGVTLKIAEVGKALGDLWKATPESVKAEFNGRAKDLAEKYKKDEAAWKETPAYAEFQKEQSVHKKKKADKKAKDTVLENEQLIVAPLGGR